MTLQERRALVRGNVLVVGVDIAQKKHYARINNGFGDELAKPFCFKNDVTGFERLESKILRLQAQTGAERVVIGMEPTGHYWKPLGWWLRNRGYLIVMVNPMLVKRHKEDLDNSPSKSDSKDTGVIADAVQQGKFMECLLPSGIYAELRVLTVVRGQQRRKLSSGLCNLRAILDEFFPEFGEVFKDPLGLGALWVLTTCPTPTHVLRMSLEELAEGLKAATNGRLGMKRAQELVAVAERSIGVPEGIEAVALRMRSAVEEVLFWKREIQTTETAMELALTKTGLGDYLTSIPGVGLVTAATFLGEIGDPSEFVSPKQIQKLAGLNVIENSSGKFRGRTTISKRGRPGLRCLLYQAAFRIVAHNAEFKALYDHFKTRPINPLKSKAALVAVGLKLLRVMFGLVKNKAFYEPTKVLGEYRESQLRAAA